METIEEFFKNRISTTLCRNITYDKHFYFNKNGVTYMWQKYITR